MDLFADAGEQRTGFGWDGDDWQVDFRVLTLGDRKDIARACRAQPEAEWPQLTLQQTLARAIVAVNDRAPAGGDWTPDVAGAPESLVTLLADAYREARLATVTPPDDAGFVEQARAECARLLDSLPALAPEADGDEIFSLLAPIPRYVWWCGEFYLVHFHILTLDERRLVARFLGVAPPDQSPHLELQHTLARGLHAVNGHLVTRAVGEGLDTRMVWVESFPESLAAILAGQYDSARAEPRGVLYGMLSSPNSGRGPVPPINWSAHITPGPVGY